MNEPSTIPLNDSDDIETLKQSILADTEEELEEFIKNASHAAYNSERKMSASFTMTATVTKKLAKGGDATYELTVDSRVRMPSEKVSRDLEIDKTGQLRLL